MNTGSIYFVSTGNLIRVHEAPQVGAIHGGYIIDLTPVTDAIMQFGHLGFRVRDCVLIRANETLFPINVH
jgi:hypothetical protein